MATYEVFAALAPFAAVQVASEETIPGDGWNYVTTLRQLRERPEMDGGALAAGSPTRTATTSASHSRDVGRVVTLSVVRSDRMPALGRALAAFAGRPATAVVGGGQVVVGVAHARASAEDFGGRSDGLIDLAHLAGLVPTSSPTTPRSSPGRGGRRRGRRGGLAQRPGQGPAQRPRDRDLLPRQRLGAGRRRRRRDVVYAKVRAAAGSPWLPMLAAFTETAARQPARPVLGEVRGSARSINAAHNVTVKATLDADDCQEVLATVTRRADGGSREVAAAWSSQPGDGGPSRTNGPATATSSATRRAARSPWRSSATNGPARTTTGTTKTRRTRTRTRRRRTTTTKPERSTPRCRSRITPRCRSAGAGRGRGVSVSLVFAPDTGDDAERIGNLDGAWTRQSGRGAQSRPSRSGPATRSAP